MTRSRHHTGWTGTFAAAAELSRRGYDVAITIGNTPHYDLLCASPSGRPLKVQVKSLADSNFVFIQKAFLEMPSDADLYLIVVLVPQASTIPYRFFISSHTETGMLWASTRKTKLNGEPYKAGAEGLSWSTVKSLEERWETLPL